MKITHTARAWTLLAVSTALGGMSAWAIERHLDQKTHEIKRTEQGEQARRLVAAHAIEAGATLQLTDIAARDIPLRWADPDSIPTTEVSRVVGMQATTALAAGQSLLNAHLSVRGEAGLATRLAPGKRAVTIPVDQVSSVSGMLSPGDLIDLYVSFDHQGRRMTAPLLSDVQVLATGRQVGLSGDGGSAQSADYGTVTLETTPAQAVKLVAARQGGSITAVLSTANSDPAVGSGAAASRRGGHLAGLLGFEQPQAPVPVPVIYGDRLMATDFVDIGEREPAARSLANGQAHE